MTEITTPPPVTPTSPNSTNITIAGAALIFTGLCAIGTKIYQTASGKEIDQLWIILIALILCLAYAPFLMEKRDANTNWGKYSLLYFSTVILLFSSTTGFNAGASNVFPKALPQEQPKVTKQGFFSFLYYAIPTIPMFGVTKDSNAVIIRDYSTAQDSLYAILSIESIRKNPEVIKALHLNKNNTKALPTDSRQSFIPRIDTVSTKSDNQYWVYLGQIVNNSWKPKNFNFTDLPIQGSQTTANTAVYKRNALPLQLTEDDWKLGLITGAVKENQKITIVRVEKIADDNYWALAKDMKGNADSARLWEVRGFEYLINKDADKAINAFNQSEQSLNGYHMAYDISYYLRSQRDNLKADANGTAWKIAYKTILEKNSWKMPDEVRMKLEEEPNSQLKVTKSKPPTSGSQLKTAGGGVPGIKTKR